MGDYVGDMTHDAKIKTDRPSGGVPANGWNTTLAWFLVFFCLWPQFLLAILAIPVEYRTITWFVCFTTMQNLSTSTVKVVVSRVQMHRLMICAVLILIVSLTTVDSIRCYTTNGRVITCLRDSACAKITFRTSAGGLLRRVKFLHCTGTPEMLWTILNKLLTTTKLIIDLFVFISSDNRNF